MKMTSREHALALAAAFGITLIEDAGHVSGSKADLAVDFKTGDILESVIHCAPITDEASYGAALHELGHVLAPSGLLRSKVRPTDILQNARLKMDEEDAAWEWARHHALDWTPTMEHVAVVARSTYTTQYDWLCRVISDREATAALLKQLRPSIAVKPLADFAGQIKWGKR